MIFYVKHADQDYQCDLTKPIDISIPVGQVKCFYSTDFRATPYVSGKFVGAVSEGAPVNFFDIHLNPHGNGTHTECFGHITIEQESINDHLKQFHFVAKLVSIDLEKNSLGDQIITHKNIKEAISDHSSEALIIRTLPNAEHKLNMDYSGTNPPYLDSEAMSYVVEIGVKHLLLDLPSVDREEDEGILKAHHIFWNVIDKKGSVDTRKDCTITELIFVPNHIEDGLYLLNIQIPSIQLDAVPSKPVLYKLSK